MNDIDGLTKNVVVFGGTSGLCVPLKKLFEQDGINGHWLSSKDCDVTKEEQVRYIIERFSPNVVLYASAINIDGFLHKQTEENLRHILDVNSIGFFNVLQNSLRQLRKLDQEGRIIYFSSLLSSRPLQGTGLYSASKSFCDSLVKTASIENKKITVNSLQLGYFDGGLTNKVPSNIIDSVINQCPLKRKGYIEEIYNMIKCIISTPYLNGANIPVTGGLHNI